MRKLLAVLVASTAAAWFAAPAFATETPNSGYIEICKYATGTPTLTGVFQFRVGDNATPVSVQVGQCSDPIPVASGSVTITEIDHPWFEVAGVTYLDSAGVTHTLAAGVKDASDGVGLWDGKFTVTVPVKGWDSVSKETVVNFTDDPVMGNLEICKTAAETSGLTGTFQFSISGDFEANLAAPADVSVDVGSCSRPISVPAGDIVVNEHKTNDQIYVTDIKVQPWENKVDVDRWKGEATVTINPGPTGETAVTFENSQSSLKLCKETGDQLVTSMDDFVFSVSADGGTVTTYSLAAALTGKQPASCVWVPLRYRAGSMITITEQRAPGTFVSGITWNGQSFDTAFDDHATVDMGARAVTFPIHAGANVVTFVNDPAPAVPLKICKLGTVTGAFSFNVDLPGYMKPFVGPAGDKLGIVPMPVSVTAGSCTFVGWFPYDSTVAITEAAGTLLDVTVDPTSATGLLVDRTLATRMAHVLLGKYDLIPALGTPWFEKAFADQPAIVDFTNGPAAAAPTGGSSTGGSSSGGSTTGTTTPVTTTSTAATASTSPPTQVTAPKVTLKVSSVRIMTVGHNRYVVVRINGAAKMARIHLTLLDKQHRIASRLTRYVATNKAVRVGNLRLANKIAGVKVSL